jgi:divalent metal cation (Fe/Co/Zn/Cd) transporter
LLENFPTLIDAAALPSDELERIALSVPGVLSVHRARSRGHAQAVYADLHIRVRSTLPTAEAHGIAHEVQRRVREQMPNVQDVTIHVEPSGPREP